MRLELNSAQSCSSNASDRSLESKDVESLQSLFDKAVRAVASERSLTPGPGPILSSRAGTPGPGPILSERPLTPGP